MSHIQSIPIKSKCMDPLDYDTQLKRYVQEIPYRSYIQQTFELDLPTSPTLQFRYPDLSLPCSPLASLVEENWHKFCNDHHLYSKSAHHLEAAKSYQLGWLITAIDPFLSFEEHCFLARIHGTLFDHDDQVDEAGNITTSHLSIIQILNGEMPTEKIMNTPSCLSALQAIYTTTIAKERQQGTDYSFALETLKQYLDSVSTELNHKTTHHDILPDDYLANRRHSGGIQFSIALFAFVRSLPVQRLFESHPWVRPLIDLVADISGLLNDILSYPKELKTYNRSPDEAVTVNLVHIKIKQGLTEKEALSECLDRYHQQLDEFQNTLKTHHAEIRDDEPLQELMFILDRWLWGHPVWATLSKRYHTHAKGLSLATWPTQTL